MSIEDSAAAAAADAATAAETPRRARKRAAGAAPAEAQAPAPAPAARKAAAKKAAAGKAPARKAATRKVASPPAVEAAEPAPRPAAPVRKAPARRAAANDASVAVRPEQAQPIYQIYFRPDQRPGLDAAFIPLDNAGHDDALREFAVFERLGADEGLRLAPLWGALSWRFGAKTGLTGEALRQAIAQHPGQDLYYCNPYPEHEALYVNGWQQGVPSHPAFTQLCTAVFKAAGLDPRELQALQDSKAFSACNYFVGSPAFWAAYLPWVRGVLDRARAGLPAPVLRVLDSRISDPKNLHAGSAYWPFIVERLLPLFLREAGQGLKVHKLVLPTAEARLNPHLQRLREMKDIAHRTRSRWLYACWLGYRNLYLTQTAGADWCKRFLPLVSITEPDFR